MFKCWIVFDLDSDSVVAFWYGESAPAIWKRKYVDSSRYEIYSEWQGGSSNYSHAAGYAN